MASRDGIDIENRKAAMLADAQAQHRHAARLEFNLLKFNFLVANRHTKLVETGNLVIHAGITFYKGVGRPLCRGGLWHRKTAETITESGDPDYSFRVGSPNPSIAVILPGGGMAQG